MGHFTSSRRHPVSRRRPTHNPIVAQQESLTLESRLMLAANAFNGTYYGHFEGTATAFGSTINIPSNSFPDNQILSVVNNGTISNRIPGTGTGTVQENGTVSFGSIAEVMGISIPVTYQGAFNNLGSSGLITGTGTWTIGANDFGITGSGTWQTIRMVDALGAVAGSTFRIDSNNSLDWDAPPSGDSVFKMGNATDIPVAGRWTAGTIFDTAGMFRDGKWYLDTGNQKYEGPSFGDLYYAFGSAGDTPVVGDWDGDGDDDLGVFRAGKFYLDANGNHVWNGPAGGDKLIPFGSVTDRPVVGDWNGDGIDDIGVFRAAGASGRFYLDSNGNGVWNAGVDQTFLFGNATDIPVAGDWNGDGDDQIGVVRGGKWYIDLNENRAWNGAGADFLLSFGSPTDRPIVGKWRPADIPIQAPPPALPPASNSNATVATAKPATITADQLAVAPKSKKGSATDAVFAELGSGLAG